jgi:single-strand DNA-binding protein
MNTVILMGRLVKDPELKTTQNGIPVCAFTLAVDRQFKNSNGERETDFLQLVAWRNEATVITKYFHKGNRIMVSGNIQSRNYTDKDGNKKSIVEIVVGQWSLLTRPTAAKIRGSTCDLRDLRQAGRASTSCFWWSKPQALGQVLPCLSTVRRMSPQSPCRL